MNQGLGDGNAYTVSSYDSRLYVRKDQERTFPPGHKDIERYLGGWHGKGYKGSMKMDYRDVLRALHAEESVEVGQRYLECTDPPYDALEHQDGLGVRDEVVFLLEDASKPRMLFFNGMDDFICNHIGNEELLINLPWVHKDEWVLSKRYAWNVELPGETIDTSPLKGYMREYQNLMFLKLLNSGHMVPMDLPSVSLEMMRTFLYSGSFQTFTQKLESEIASTDDDDGNIDTENEVSCDDVECPACEPQTTAPLLPEQTNGDYLHHKTPEDITDDDAQSDDGKEDTNEESSEDELTTNTHASSTLEETGERTRNRGLLTGLLLGSLFGCIMTITVNRIWGFIRGDKDRIGYEIGTTTDFDLKFRDRLDYNDDSESTPIGGSPSKVIV